MTMPEHSPICFFVRCKPQGADVIDLVESTKRVFIGYPPWRKDRWQKYDPNNIRASIIDIMNEDLTELDFEHNPHINRKSYRRQISTNLNLVREIKDNPGSIVLIPRPESGLCYIGIVDCFELVDRPSWINEYRALRENQRSRIVGKKQGVWDDVEGKYHVGDVVQAFNIGGSLKKIPFFAIPAWIRYQLSGRATVGRIRPIIASQNPFETLTQVYEHEVRPVTLYPVLDADNISDMLLNLATPSIFELLACELLQLDREGEYWWHVGGPGDGGVDGLGFNKAGQLLGALQCKLGESSETYLMSVGREMKDQFKNDELIFVFSLYTDLGIVVQDGITIYGRRGIVELLMKHRDKSSFAAMLGLR